MVSSARTSSLVAWVIVMPIALTQPSGMAFSCSENSSAIDRHRNHQKKLRVGNSPDPQRLRSQYYRLRLQEPDPVQKPRGLRPPELLAGKRGGWYRDSVYPKLRLTSFAPRAL